MLALELSLRNKVNSINLDVRFLPFKNGSFTAARGFHALEKILMVFGANGVIDAFTETLRVTNKNNNICFSEYIKDFQKILLELLAIMGLKYTQAGFQTTL